LHRRLPPKYDLLRRAHGWKEMARMVGQARQELAAEGPPAFIIAEHYGFTSQLSFYLPEAKRKVNAEPLVYFYASAHPINQFIIGRTISLAPGRMPSLCAKSAAPPCAPIGFPLVASGPGYFRAGPSARAPAALNSNGNSIPSRILACATLSSTAK
jgi:hypothetical protein